MFSSFKCTSTLSRSVRFKNLFLPYCYFSETNDRFIKKTRILHKLKTNTSSLTSTYERGKYLIFLKSELVCLEKSNKLVIKNFKDLEQLKKFGEVTTILLDILTDSGPEICLYAANLTLGSDADIKEVELKADGKFVNMRHTLFFLDKKDAQYVTQARGLLNFNRSYKFCCYCGGSLVLREGGLQKQCTECKFIHYPPLAPIGITLIESENHEEVLLVRQKKHPPGMYTCVAGFIEPGESLEENVAREVAEEVGVILSKVEYITSQHWAIPTSQLILGCIATAHGNGEQEIEIDHKEILDAKWVKPEELSGAVTRVKQVKSIEHLHSETLWAPPSNAVSHYLMVTWLTRYHNFEPHS